MNIDYQNLTEEILEDWIEFVDWSLVPSSLITQGIRDKFESHIAELRMRIWFEDLLKRLTVKEDKNEYPNSVFFFEGDKFYMSLNKNNGELWCSRDKIWFVFYKKLKYNYNETQKFIKNFVEQNFNMLEIRPSMVGHITRYDTEKHFKKLN